MRVEIRLYNSFSICCCLHTGHYVCHISTIKSTFIDMAMISLCANDDFSVDYTFVRKSRDRSDNIHVEFEYYLAQIL